MPLRSFRFYLSGYLHYYGHLRIPRLLVDDQPVRDLPTFMRYLGYTRNIILPRVSVGLLFAVSSTNMAGFSTHGRMTNTDLCNEA
jgi:hypothetical protein